MPDRPAYSSLNGIGDGSNLRRDLTDELLAIGSAASLGVTSCEERDGEAGGRAISEIVERAKDLPRLLSRVQNWERAFGRKGRAPA